MKNFLVTTISLFLSFFVSAGLYFSGASGVTQNKPSCNTSSTNGSLSLAAGTYKIAEISSTGDYTLGVEFWINGYRYNVGNNIVVANSNSIPCQLKLTTPSSVLCNKKSNFKIRLTNYNDADAAVTEGWVNIINSSAITGSVNFCGAATNAFTTNISNGTVNISKPGWKVNGQTPPVSIGSTFSVTSPGGNDKDVTLTFTSSCACSHTTINLYTNTANSPQPTSLTYAAPIDCLYRLTTNNFSSTVYQYEWADNAAFNYATITKTNTTLEVGDNWELKPCESLTVYIRTRNACSVSSPKIQSITFPTMLCCQMTGCCGYGTTPSPGNNEFQVTYFQNSNQIHIEYLGSEEFYGGTVQILSIEGILLETINFDTKIADLTAYKVQKGINLVRIVYNNKYYAAKIIKG